jgi:5-methylcytosine-specific restriction endonuclease McrA
MSRKRTNYMHQADALFARMIRARDQECLACHSTSNMQCAHIISRSYKSIRTDPDNAVTLCRSCHLRFTHRPLEWEAWVETQFPGRWDWLRAKALKYERVDWRKEVEVLRGPS